VQQQLTTRKSLIEGKNGFLCFVMKSTNLCNNGIGRFAALRFVVVNGK
jgi:hypothetical protein